LNVAYGVENAFPDLFIYKTLSIMDLPDTNIISYIKECAQFIDQAKAEVTFAFCFLIVYIKYISVDIAQIHLFLLKFLHFASML